MMHSGFVEQGKSVANALTGSAVRRLGSVLGIAAGLTFAANSHAEFVVDGILTPGADTGYQEFALEFVEENGAVGSGYFGKLWLGFGKTASDPVGTNDIFILLEVPTEIQDLTYGDNASWGWYDTSDPDPNNWSRSGSAEYDKVTGSENWRFCFGSQSDCGNDETIKIKMKDTDDGGTKNDGLPPGFEIDRDTDGIVVAASTSLDYNLNSSDLSSTIAGNQLMTSFTEDSPFCGDVQGTPHTSDQDCYNELAANYDDYQFSQRYEIQIDNSTFALTDINEVFDYINNSVFHASRPKFADENIDFELPCLDPGEICDPVTPPTGGVPIPSSLSLFTLAGALMIARRRRR